MKRIYLDDLPDPRFAPSDPNYEPNRVEYRALIEQAIRVPLDRQQGATIDEMRKGIRVLDALERVGLHGTVEPGAHGVELHPSRVLELEDADWEFLKLKVEKMPWALTDRRLVKFYDDIMGATEAVRDPTHENGVAA